MVSCGGSVFTKSWVVSMMLRISGYTPNVDLSKIRVLEPSCGEGAFLIPVVESLCQSALDHGHDFIDLIDQIDAYDLDPIKVNNCRINISNALQRNGCPLDIAQQLATSWITTGDFLLADIERQYDLVIGNPPYIKAVDIERPTREAYIKCLETMTLGTDIFVGFIEKGLKLLKKGGKLCYICADRWMQNSYGKKLRKYILSNHHMDIICRMHEVDAFEDRVDAYPAIILIDDSELDSIYANCDSTFNSNDVNLFIDNIRVQDSFKCSSFEMCHIPSFDPSEGPWSLTDANTLHLIHDLTKRFPCLEDTGVSIGIGVATGKDEVFIIDEPDLIESDRQLPLLCNKDIVDKVPPVEPKHWLVNPWESDGTLIDLEQYPLTSNYLGSHSKSLSSRHVVKRDATSWYRTIDKVDVTLKEKPKLLFSDLSSRSDPIYDAGMFYPHHNLYWCTSDRWDMKVLGGILMSEQMESVVDAYCVKMRGRTMRFQAQYLRKIHIPEPNSLNESDSNELAHSFMRRDRESTTEIVANILKEGYL